MILPLFLLHFISPFRTAFAIGIERKFLKIELGRRVGTDREHFELLFLEKLNCELYLPGDIVIHSRSTYIYEDESFIVESLWCLEIHGTE